MFQNPYGAGAPFQADEKAQQQHVEYLHFHEKPDVKRVTTTHLHVDNRDRQTSFDAQRGNSAPFNFVVKFAPIYNVTGISLRAVSCPKPLSESYIVLDIAQFTNQLQSTDSSNDQKFSVIYFDQFEPSTEVKPVKSDLISCSSVAFDPPTTLARLDVTLRTHGGSIMTPVANGSTKVSLLLDVISQELSSTYGI